MKKIPLLFLPLLFMYVFAAAQANSTVEKYIVKYKEIAINEEIRTGVPAAITLAQGIFESMAGQSDLAVASNNHFGIKCKEEWTGDKVYHDDDARGECFRSYTSVEESYRDHSDFLKTRPHYASLFTLDPLNYEAWAYGLKKAGYATNPVYAKLIIKKIEDYSLQQYTLIALQKSANGIGADIAKNSSANNSGLGMAVETAAPAEPELEEFAGESNYPAGKFAINKTKVIYATAGTSLFALASNNNIALERLLEFNDLDNSIDILAKSQLIYLEKKPRKSNAKDFHLVGNTETMEDIAQKEGIQLESLFEYNKMQKGLQPMAGEKIYLKPGRYSYYPKLLPKSNSKLG